MEVSFYSQNGEDCLLYNFFDKKNNGFFVDVGAFDGKYLSNTFLFENLGWGGICIEPNPEAFNYLEIKRRKSTNLNYACIDDENISSVVLNVVSMGYLSTIDNSIERENDIIKRYKKRGFDFEGFKKIDVKAITLNAILKNHALSKEIDFLKIDVESAELIVLKGLNLKKYKPRVIILEANTSDFEKELREYMDGKGYYFVGRLIENIFFVSDKNDIEKMRGIKINCIIDKQVHPLSPKYSIEDLLVGKRISTTIKY